MHHVFLLLGTNLGNKLNNLKNARAHLTHHTRIVKTSSVYRTDAWGKTDQAEFYNQVLEIATALDPQALLQIILSIELAMGRHRLEKWGERIIDIDILLFDNLIIQNDALTIPHPQMQFRRFTLEPLAEIAGDVIHPTLKQSVSTLLAVCPDPLNVTKINLSS